MFNRGTNGGSLFGNANTSTPTSTPAPPSNTLQVPQKSGNLFGNANAGIGVSTPSPSGGLFGNTTTQGGGGGFGNQSNESKPLFSNGTSTTNANSGSSLFGNPESNMTAPRSFSFGNNASKTNPTSGMSNSSGGFFSNNGPTQSANLLGHKQSGGAGGLFGRSSGFEAPEQQQQQQQPFLNGGANTSNPYGMNINNMSIPVSNMPAPLTSSQNPKRERDSSSGSHGLSSSGPGADNKRNFSVSSSTSSNFSINAPLPSLSHSSLVNKLSARLKTVNQASSIQGIFSPFRNKYWDNHETGGIFNSNASEYKPTQLTNSIVPSKGLPSFALRKGEVSDMRKLKIDPNRSAAKKLKLLSGVAAITKAHERENGGIKSLDLKNDESPSYPVSTIDKAEEIPGGEIQADGNVNDSNSEKCDNNEYWCTPSVDQLSRLPLKQLSVLPDFVIGRKGYGYITFNSEVDLTAFAPDFEQELFGKVVVFHPTKTVEVYPDGTQKASIGQGLNIPATITLENIYPIDRKTKKPLTDGSRSREVQLLIKRLKNMRDMEFISYNPFGGVWTFKVNHFSIWGLVNKEDVEMDAEDLEKSKKENTSSRVLAFPKNKRKLAQSNATMQKPISNVGQHLGDDGDKTQNDLLALQQRSQVESNYDFDDEGNDDLFLEEKPYEPDVSERDFEGMEIEPSLNVSTDWLTQLKLAGSSLQSVFFTPKRFEGIGKNEVGTLFTEFDKGIESDKKVKKERRLTSRINFANFCPDSKLLIKDSADLTGVRSYNLLSPFQKDLKAINSLFRNQLKVSVIMERQSNSYPIVTQNSLQFRNVVDFHKTTDPDYYVWKLCSVLFDPTDLPSGVTRPEVKVNLLKKERHRLICAWIVEQVKDEIDTKLKKASNPLDKIFLHLCKNDVVGASQLAMNSQNGHLAILVSFLGSNDPGIRELATLQLKKWSSGGNKINPSIARIYQLLTGDLVSVNFLTPEIMDEFSWLSLLGITLYYGNIDDLFLEDLVNKFLKYYKKFENDIFFVILSLFSTSESSETMLKKLKMTTTALESLFPWYFVQILRFGTSYKFSDEISDKLTLSSIEELKIANLHKEALFAACFLSSDSVAKQQIDLLVFLFIGELSNASSGYILDRLKISTKLIYEAKALNDKYHGDHLSEAENLLKAKSYKEAERIIVTLVAPRLVIQYVSARAEELKILDRLLSSFPKNEMESWENGLGVFANYLKLVLKSNHEEELLTSLVNGLALLYDGNRWHKEIPVCCNIMAQELVTAIVRRQGKELGDNMKCKLLKLPLGQPEKVYLESMLAMTI